MRWKSTLAAWLAVLTLFACIAPTGALAQATVRESADPAEPDVAALRLQLDRLPATATGGEGVRALQSRLNTVVAAAEKVIAARTGQLNDLNARLGELGPPPAEGASEDADITRQRQSLTRDRNTVDADIRLARLVVVDARQRSDALQGRQRDLFEAELTGRGPSPLGAPFWRALGQAWPEDQVRLQPLLDELQTAWLRATSGAHRWPVLVALVLTVLVVTVGDVLAERGLVRLAQRLLPAGRLRRSLLVIAIVAVNMLVVAMAVRALQVALEARDLFGPLSSKLLGMADESMLFIAFVTSLGRALLSNARPSWRLPRIPDALALRLSLYPWLTALLGMLVWVPSRVNVLVEASDAAVHATHVVTALALVLLIVVLLLLLRSPQLPRPVEGEAAAAQADVVAERPLWLVLVLGAVTLALIGIVVLVAVGYAALAGLLAAQVAWTGLVAAAFYVLFKFADDLFMALVSSRSELGRRLQESFDFAPSTLDQAAVVLSALARVALFFYMVVALVAPLGTGPGEVVERSGGQLSSGLKVGEFQLVPTALFSALVVLVVGFIVLRVFQRWLQERYLPTTAMEPGMQSSIQTLLGYAGGTLVVAAALSALGIGVNRIAWIASALSVGIGFGLQAVVQNFISGLILLVERPVKVGDWVVLGTTEGDIKRINVRATEIQLGDRSTVIVPNSEFITKTVRNMTLTSTEGRVLIRLPMPLSTDAPRVRDLILAACAAHPGVLPAPAPSLTLEGIEHGMLIFQAICYVASPRLAGGVRSDLLFTVLEELAKAGLPMAVPTFVVGAPADSSAPPASPLPVV
jgi:potassium efflux system protein